MTQAIRLTVVFVVVFGAIIGLTFLSAPTTDTATVEPTIENPQYEDPGLLPETAPGNATIELQSAEPTNTILIDPGGFGSVTDRDLLPLTNALTAAGHDVKIRAGGSLEDDLEEADGFLTVGIGGYSADEIEAIGEFADDGGRVIFTLNPGDEFSDDLSAAELRTEFGFTVEPGYVYNLAENDLNYQRLYGEPGQDSAVTDGVDRVVFQSATPLTSRSVDGTIEPAAGSALSTTREETSTPIMIHDDNVVIIGDSQFMHPENTQRADNDVLVGNLADFLVTGSTDTED